MGGAVHLEEARFIGVPPAAGPSGANVSRARATRPPTARSRRPPMPAPARPARQDATGRRLRSTRRVSRSRPAPTSGAATRRAASTAVACVDPPCRTMFRARYSRRRATWKILEAAVSSRRGSASKRAIRSMAARSLYRPLRNPPTRSVVVRVLIASATTRARAMLVPHRSSACVSLSGSGAGDDARVRSARPVATNTR